MGIVDMLRTTKIRRGRAEKYGGEKGQARFLRKKDQNLTVEEKYYREESKGAIGWLRYLRLTM